MTDRRALLIGGTGLLLLQVLMSAHHSFAADFDAAKPVKLTGTVSRMEWTNPHAHLHVDVTEPRGVRSSWNIELGTPNALMRGGWSRNSLKPGDTVTVNGYAAKDGSRFANAQSVMSSDGRTLFARSSLERTPTR
jgi:hypothetical protein